MTGKNTCAMSEACEGKDADHGMMCRECREADMLITDECSCASCAGGWKHVHGCLEELDEHHY